MIEKYFNVLSHEEHLQCYNYLMESEGWAYTGFSVDINRRFWTYKLDNNVFFSNYFKQIIEQTTKKKFNLLRVYANGQTFGQCGSIHIDDNDPSCYTFLYYSNPIWEKDWGGSTFFYSGDDQVSNSFLPNSGILFQSCIPHIGMEPSSLFKDLRITIAFKLELIK